MSRTPADPRPAEDVVIDVRHLTKRFGDRVVVDDVSLEVRRGEVVGFLGPNGSGKTTTIRLICGLLRLDAGEGEVLGLDIRTESREIKARVGYMTQRFSLYEDLSIEENLDLVAGLYRLPEPRANVAALARLGLVRRAVGDETDPGKLGDDPISLRHAIHRLGDHLADDGRGEIPLLEDRTHEILVTLAGDDEHALLRLAGQDLGRRHRGLAQRHPLEPDPHAGAGCGGGLGERARQAGAAEVLNADDEAGVFGERQRHAAAAAPGIENPTAHGNARAFEERDDLGAPVVLEERVVVLGAEAPVGVRLDGEVVNRAHAVVPGERRQGQPASR